MCNSNTPSTPSQKTTNSNPNDPEMSEVLNTLRILSRASAARRNAAMTKTDGHSNLCPNCNRPSNVSTTGGGQQQWPRSREEVLLNLSELEVKLRAKGEELPAWVQSWKDGDSKTAAKLLHIAFVNRNKARTALKRQVQEIAPHTISTDSNEVVESVPSNDQALNLSTPAKRRRLVIDEEPKEEKSNLSPTTE